MTDPAVERAAAEEQHRLLDDGEPHCTCGYSNRGKHLCEYHDHAMDALRARIATLTDEVAGLVEKFGKSQEHLSVVEFDRDYWKSQLEEARKVVERHLAVLWKIRMTAERSTVDEPPFVLPTQIIHLAEGAMGRDRRRAQELAALDATTSPPTESTEES